MKKILYIFCVVLVFILCSVGVYLYSGTTHKIENLGGTYTFNLELAKPAIGWDDGVRRYMMEMYTEDLSSKPVKQSNNTGEFSVTMEKGVDYICLFWADDGTTYNAENLRAVRQIDDTKSGTPAYAASVEVKTRRFNGSVKLEPVVAKIEFADKNGLVDTLNTLTVTYPYSSTLFDVSRGVVERGGDMSVRIIEDVKAVAADKPFAYDYVFASSEEESLDDIKVKLNDEADRVIKTTPIKAGEIANISSKYCFQLYKIGDLFPSAASPMGVVFWVDAKDASYNKDDKSSAKGLMVSLNEYSNTQNLTSVWSTEDVIVGAYDQNDGKANMKAVSDYIENNNKSWDQYPIFKWIQGNLNHKKGGSMSWNKNTDRWYLPSKRELEKLYAGFSGIRYEDIKGWSDKSPMPNYDTDYAKEARSRFNIALIKAGGDKLETSALTAYWSSTEMSFNTVCFINLYRGHRNYSNKILSARTRAVSSF